jgi:hypothetical protein
MRLAHRTGRPVALGISGTHEKGDHILGREVSAGPAPASSLAAFASAADADAWSTALFLADFEEGLAWLQDWPGPAPAIARIEADETPRWNGVFQQLWGAPA